MSKEHVTDASLSREDATRLDQSYKILAGLQRTTLGFLRALEEYEKRNRRQQRPREGNNADDGPSRLAFIVTPLMVNHYNHMHRVYRASMYGQVPDLCDQTGGIVCADLGALREELATRTTDVNRSLTSTFRTTMLPDVQFEFVKKRDNVLESAVRLLDSINVKQPDLTSGIRDDYVQNVRAIQESLTGALEKSKERASELQSRLNDALRKLALCEKSMISIDRGNGMTEDSLRREISKLKDTILEQQRRLLEQEIHFNEKFIDLVRSNEASEMMLRLRDRLKELFKNETEGIANIKNEIMRYAQKEMEQMSANFEKIREDVISYTNNALARSGEDKEKTRELYHTLLSHDAEIRNLDAISSKDTTDQLSRLQNDYTNLKKENENLKRRCDEMRRTVIDLHTNETKLRMEIEDVTQRLKASQTELTHCVGVANQGHMEKQNLLENAAQSFDAIRIENAQLSELVKQSQVLQDYQLRDLRFLYDFFKENVRAAVELAEYMYSNGMKVYSEFAHMTFIPHLQNMLIDEDVKAYIHKAEIARAHNVMHSGGVLKEIETTKCNVVHLNQSIQKVLGDIRNAYIELMKHFDLPDIQHHNSREEPNEYFVRLFGPNLITSLSKIVEKIKNDCEKDRNAITMEKNDCIHRIVESMRNAYTGLAKRFELPNIQQEQISTYDPIVCSERLFGQSLITSLSEMFNKLKNDYEKDKNAIEEKKDIELLRITNSLTKELNDVKEQITSATSVVGFEQIMTAFDGNPLLFERTLSDVFGRPDHDTLRTQLYDSYQMCSLNNLEKYETSTGNEELKLCNLVDYDSLTENIRGVFHHKDARLHEIANPRLNGPEYFLNYFLDQLGNARVENYIKEKNLHDRNKLATMLFKRYYVPVINKESFILSIEGPFANFDMVYKVGK